MVDHGYKIDKMQLDELFIKVNNKELTNEECWKLAKCGKTKWYELKNLYNK